MVVLACSQQHHRSLSVMMVTIKRLKVSQKETHQTVIINLARVDKDGENPKEVLIDPPNIRTKPVKKGAAIDSVLFSKPGYTSVNDPYI